MKSTLIAVCAFIAALTAVHPAFADDKRTTSPRGGEVWAEALKAYENAKRERTVVHVPPVIKAPLKRAWIGHTVTISPSERDAIRAYVRNRIDASRLGKPNGVPQGLAKKVTWGWGKIPEGWQKQCVRGRVLPGEVHEHCQPLPEELTVKLPPPPPGTVLLAVDGNVVRVGYPTYEILDVFDVLAPPAELKASPPPRAVATPRGAYSEMIPIVASHRSTN